MKIIIKPCKLNSSYNFNCSGYGLKHGCSYYCSEYHCPCISNRC